jgi:hypothetical protein
MKISELKQPYRAIAEWDAEEQDSCIPNHVSKSIEWCSTKAGSNFYSNLNEGIYPEITDQIKADYKEVFDKLEAEKVKIIGNTVDENTLLDFLLVLNEKGLINNHDFDYEKEAKLFIKKLSAKQDLKKESNITVQKIADKYEFVKGEVVEVLYMGQWYKATFVADINGIDKFKLWDGVYVCVIFYSYAFTSFSKENIRKFQPVTTLTLEEVKKKLNIEGELIIK